MGFGDKWRRLLVVALAIALVVSIGALAGCADEPSNPQDEPAPEPAQSAETPAEPEEPKYTSWVVYINDDDSYSKGGITYSIALNLTATNPSADPAGTYTGEATAKTDTTGDVGGAQLNASAIANSSNLEFELAEGSGGDLAPLTKDTVMMQGTGSITMAAAGSGTVGAAGGSFSNTSSQKITLEVVNDKVTLIVPIDGHKYRFNGTLSGK